MNVGEIRATAISMGADTISCDVVETGDLSSTSHAGIVVSVNGQKVVGGHESEITMSGDGESMNALMLAMQHRLASIAQKNLVRVNDLIQEHIEQ